MATIPPASETARRAAEPCATAASASACAGCRPRAHSAPTAPARTSPAPAVASWGTGVSTTRSGSPLSATSVSGPLSRTAAPESSAASVTLASLAPAIASLSRPSRRPSSPACGVSAVGPARSRSVSQSTGEREQRIGVEHERHLDPAHERVDELGCARGAPEAGAGDDCARPGCELEHVLGFELALHHELRAMGRDGTTLALGHADPHHSGAGSQRRQRRQRGRAAHARRPADDEHAARVVLRAGRRPGWHERQIGRVHAQGPRRAGERTRQADRQLDHLARVASARLDGSAERAAVEGERERGLDRRALDPPARAVDATGHVERDDGRGEAR